jgi:hypothetical protein
MPSIIFICQYRKTGPKRNDKHEILGNTNFYLFLTDPTLEGYLSKRNENEARIPDL